MAERPILFNGPMVRAVLAGTKVETRRPVNGAPLEPNLVPMRTLVASQRSLVGTFSLHRKPCPPVGKELWRGRCPYGAPGDRLWVREAFAACTHGANIEPHYRADGDLPAGWGCPACQQGAKTWTPSIHMPRWASRIDLRVKSVRIERVQAITEAGALAEGFEPVPSHGEWCDPKLGRMGHWTARKAFHDMWVAVYGQDAWDSNPWVWVVGFEREEVARG